ncbi:MAG: hypothetical protein ABSG49_06840 [Methanoregula sp.]|uniref:hypothetical protein n=1 Tax=Methanoregula sp. TaxID=2052170 RepID=UPI003C1E09CD
MTDTLDHITWSNYIFLTGHILPADYNALYANFPLYHILVAMSSHLTNLNVKMSLFFIMGLIFVGTIWFVYLFLFFTIKNKQISLLSCLVYANFTIVVFYGSYMITRALAFVGFIIMLYLVFKISQEKRYRRHYILLIIPVFVFLVTVHPVSLPQFLLIMAVMLACVYLFCQDRINDFSILAVLVIIFIAYWMYVSLDLASALTDERLRSITVEGIFNAKDPTYALMTKKEGIAEIVYYITHNIQIGIFMLFGLFGLGYAFYRKKPVFAVIFAVFSICMIPFFVPTPLNSIYLIDQILGFYRFSLYIAPFMALIMAAGILFLLQIRMKNERSRYILWLAIFCFFAVFSVLSLTSVSVAGDSQDLWPNYSSTYFNNEDLQSFSFFEIALQNGDMIISDFFVDSYLRTENYPGLNKIDLKYFHHILIPSPNQIDQIPGYIFYRKGEFYHKGVLSFGQIYFIFSPGNAQLIEFKLNSQEKIYSSGSNELFLKSS